MYDQRAALRAHLVKSAAQNEQMEMVKTHLFNMAKQAKELHGMLGDQDQVPEWVQEKLAVSCNMLDAIYDYLSPKMDKSAAHRLTPYITGAATGGVVGAASGPEDQRGSSALVGSVLGGAVGGRLGRTMGQHSARSSISSGRALRVGDAAIMTRGAHRRFTHAEGAGAVLGGAAGGTAGGAIHHIGRKGHEDKQDKTAGYTTHLPLAAGVLAGTAAAAHRYAQAKPRDGGLSRLQVEARSDLARHREHARNEGQDPEAGLKAKYLKFKDRVADASAKETLISAAAFGVPVGVAAGLGTRSALNTLDPYVKEGPRLIAGTPIGNALGIKK